MAINKFTGAVSKKASATGNWSLGHKPKAEEDVEIEEGKEIEWNTAVVGRSLYVRKNVVMTGIVTTTIGNSEKPEGPGGSGVILTEEAGVVWPNGFEVQLRASYTASELPIGLGAGWYGKESGRLSLGGSAKYGFTEDTRIDAQLEVRETASWKTNSHEVTLSNKARVEKGEGFNGMMLFSSTPTLTLGSSTIKLGIWPEDTAVTVNQGTSTISIAAVASGHFNGTHTYYNVTFEGGRPLSLTSYTVEGTLRLNQTNGYLEVGYVLIAAAVEETVEGKEIQRATAPKTITLKKGAQVVSNGTAEHPAEAVGYTEAERSKLVLEEDIEVKGVLNWKYIEAVNHTIYAPEAQSITGCSKIVKEAKPGAGAVIPVEAASASSSASLNLHAPTSLPVSTAESTSAASLALRAPTPVPLAASAASSAASLALNAKSQIPVAAASAESAAQLALNAATTVPPGVASAVSAGSLVLNAATQVPVGEADAVSAGQIAVHAATVVSLAAASASSAGTLSVNAATLLPVEPAAAGTSAQLALQAVTAIPVGAAGATSSGALSLTTPTGGAVVIEVAPAESVSSTSLALQAATTVAPSAAQAGSSASLVLTAATIVPVSAAAASLSGALALSTGAVLVLAPAVSGSSASLTMRAPTALPTGPAQSESSGTLMLQAPVLIPVAPAFAVSTASLALSVNTSTYPARMVLGHRGAANIRLGHRGAARMALTHRGAADVEVVNQAGS